MNMKIRKLQIAVVIAACVITVLLRVRDTPFQLDSMIALALLCGAVVRHPLAILIPLCIRLFTDILLWQKTGYGFYPSMAFDYAAYLGIAMLARSVPVQRYASTMFAGSLLGPALFFLVSNFGVWYLWPDTYAPTTAGLLSCYAAGLPFFKASFGGNFIFSLLFLGAWHGATIAGTNAKSFAAYPVDGSSES
jgi:hypothetical protein